MGTSSMLIDNKLHGPLFYISTDIVFVCFDVTVSNQEVTLKRLISMLPIAQKLYNGA